MSGIIYFRSKYFSGNSSGTAEKYSKGRSYESGDLRGAHIGDDSRDIVWKKSTENNLVVKNRYIQKNVAITVIEYDDSFDDVKKAYTAQLKNTIRTSAQFTGNTYNKLSGKTDEEFNKKLISIRNNLIIVISDSLEIQKYARFQNLMSTNDVLFIVVFHLYELREMPGLLFESKTIQKKYYNAIHKRIAELQQGVIHLGGNLVTLHTFEDAPLKCNHFFKHRYG